MVDKYSEINHQVIVTDRYAISLKYESVTKFLCCLTYAVVTT